MSATDLAHDDEDIHMSIFTKKDLKAKACLVIDVQLVWVFGIERSVHLSVPNYESKITMVILLALLPALEKKLKEKVVD